MPTKSAADTTEAFKDLLSDVTTILSQKKDIDPENASPGTRLLLSIFATMSDDAASVQLFNSNVEKLMNEAKAAYSNNEEIWQ